MSILILYFCCSNNLWCKKRRKDTISDKTRENICRFIYKLIQKKQRNKNWLILLLTLFPLMPSHKHYAKAVITNYHFLHISLKLITVLHSWDRRRHLGHQQHINSHLKLPHPHLFYKSWLVQLHCSTGLCVGHT